MRKDKRFKHKANLSKGILLTANIIMWLLILFPFIYALSISFTPLSDLFDPDRGFFPSNPTFQNFIEVFDYVPLSLYIRNTVIVALSIVFFQVVTSFLAAFAFVFLEFKGSGIIYALILSTMMVPGEALLISQYLMVSSWGLNDTLWVLIIPSIVSAFNIFFAVQSMKNFPYEVYEASITDGCTDFQFVFRILLPMMTPTIGAMSVNSFIGAWNMYTWPLLTTNGEKVRTIQLAVSQLSAVDAESRVLMMAGVILSMLPSIIIFAIGQRYMREGLNAGAVKG